LGHRRQRRRPHRAFDMDDLVEANRTNAEAIKIEFLFVAWRIVFIDNTDSPLL
jgi:hypothetical protein